MNSTVQLTAVICSNTLGIILLLVLILNNTWRLTEQKKEKKILLSMIIVALISNVADPLIFALDARPDLLSRGVIFFGNFWLFLANMIVGPLWIRLVLEHSHAPFTKRHRCLVKIICTIGIAVLIINLFQPIVYWVDAGGVYHRAALYWLFTFLEAIFILDGIWCHYRAKRKGGVLQFFPVLQFIVPIVIGIIIQSAFYGVTMIWPCIAIALCGVTTSLQNEMVFRDQLTGLYNRYYLDYIKKRLDRKSQTKMTAMMMDLNGFKYINDELGHSVGDEALVETARLLREIVGTLGNSIRYAGDEFVVLLNTQDEEQVKLFRAQLRDSFEQFNKTSGKPYQLSLSMGCCSVDLGETSMDDILAEVDRLMYQDKKEYYENHPQKDRRSRE